GYTQAEIVGCKPGKIKHGGSLKPGVVKYLENHYHINDCSEQQAMVVWQMSTSVAPGNITAVANFVGHAKQKHGGNNDFGLFVCQNGGCGSGTHGTSPLTVYTTVNSGNLDIVFVMTSDAPQMTKPGPRPTAHSTVQLTDVTLSG